MQYIRIKEWDTFQHYKDRSPPWIKLHKSMLNSRTWVRLDDAGRVLAFACMMLAADTDNKTPLDPEYLARVAYLNAPPNFDNLVRVGFIEIIEEKSETIASASKPQAKRTVCPPEQSRAEQSFATFWACYPKHKSKGQAEKAFAKINPDEQLLTAMVAAVERAKTQDDWRKDNGKFIPYPATWLNGKGWLDDVAAKPQLRVAM